MSEATDFDRWTKIVMQALKEIPPGYWNLCCEKAQQTLKGRLMQYTEEDLATLARQQVIRLRQIGVREDLLSQLTAKLSTLLPIAREMVFWQNGIPFIPVIPKRVLELGAQIKMIFTHGRQGETTLIEDMCEDLGLPLPPGSNPYWALDLDNGGDVFEEAPEKAREIIIEQGRLGLTACEVIGLSIHNPEILGHHCLDAVGSRYIEREIDQVPTILSLSGTTILMSRDASEARKHYGAPSCGKRI